MSNSLKSSLVGKSSEYQILMLRCIQLKKEVDQNLDELQTKEAQALADKSQQSEIRSILKNIQKVQG